MRIARRILTILLPLGASATLAAEPAPPPTDAPRPLMLEDHDSIKSPESLSFSRDGKQVTFVLEDQIYVVPAAGGAPRAVTAAGSSAWDPVWSKDGSSLYFLSDRSESNQLWKLPLATFGKATQVTTFEHGIDSLGFSPDESKLLLSFTAEELKGETDEEVGKEEDEDESDKESDEETAEPFVITRLDFKEDDGEGYLTGDRFEHLHAFDLATQKLIQLTSGDYSESQADWSPDGRQIVFVSNREEESDASYKTDLWLVASDNTDQGKTLVRLTNDDRVKSDRAWSPDGRSIAFLTGELDRWVNSLSFSEDGQWVYFAYEHEGGSRLARVRAKDGRLEPVEEGEQFIGEFDLAKNGAIAARIETGNRGPELYSIAKGRLNRLTRINDGFLSSITPGAKETISFKSADGTVVQDPRPMTAKIAAAQDLRPGRAGGRFIGRLAPFPWPVIREWPHPTWSGGRGPCREGRDRPS